MKPLREFSTEQLEQLTNDEIIKLVVSEIKSSRATNSDLEEEHVRLASTATARKEIKALWRDEMEWRAKIEEAKKPIEGEIIEPAKPAVSLRRYAISDHIVKKEASYFLSATQPAAEESKKHKEEPKPKEPQTEPTTEEAVSKLILALPAKLREDVFKTLGVKRLTEAKADSGVKALTFQHSKSPTGIPGSLENALIAIDKLEIDCKYDVFHDRIYFGGEPIYGGLDAVALRVRQMVLGKFKFDPGGTFTFDALRVICLDRVFDPVLDYLDGIQWDGKPRLDRWLVVYGGADDTALNRAIGRKCLIAAVRRVRQPGCKFDYVVCLESRRQGIGKSTMIRILAGDENFSDAEIIGLKKQEQQEAVQGVWIYEIGEMQGMSKADVRHIKQFASRMVDSARPAYGRTRVDRPRRCIFFATTNETTYLRDATGNRRFWPVRLHGVIPHGDLMMIDLVAVKRDRDQLWAEAVEAEASGEDLVIPEALWADVEAQQLARMEVDPWTDTLENWLADCVGKGTAVWGAFGAGADDKGEPEWRVEGDYLLTQVIGIPKDRQHNTHSKRLVEIMSGIGWHYCETTMRIAGKTTRGYFKPVPEDELNFWQKAYKRPRGD
jgi:Virulence-associated protein E